MLRRKSGDLHHLCGELLPAVFPACPAFVTILQITGWAWLEGTAERERQSEGCSTFTAKLCKLFRLGNPQSSAGCWLLALRQGERSTSDDSIEFCTLASRSQWSRAALVDTFLRGFSAWTSSMHQGRNGGLWRSQLAE